MSNERGTPLRSDPVFDVIVIAGQLRWPKTIGLLRRNEYLRCDVEGSNCSMQSNLPGHSEEKCSRSRQPLRNLSISPFTDAMIAIMVFFG